MPKKRKNTRKKIINEKVRLETRLIYNILLVLWQPLITKTNDHTSSKSLKADIKWEVHKRTQQGVSAKLESYIYKVHMVHATNNYTCPYVYAISSYLPHFLLKATMLYICVLTSSSRSFYYILGL